MQLAVFGSTGLAGTAVTRLALENGNQVRALVRGPREAGREVPGLEVIGGDALDPFAVAETVNGADAVISTLGGFRGPESLASGTRNIVTAMRETGGGRLVVLQGFHIHFPGDPGGPGRWLVEMYLGRQCRPLLTYGAELGELLQATEDVSWTLLRIPQMVGGGPSSRARTGRFSLGPWSSVRVDDVAIHLLTLAQHDTFVHQAPMLHTHRSWRSASDSIPAVPIHHEQEGQRR